MSRSWCASRSSRRRCPHSLQEQTGATLVKLPIMPGGVPNTSTYIEMMDYIIHTMVAAEAKRG